MQRILPLLAAALLFTASAPLAAQGPELHRTSDPVATVPFSTRSNSVQPAVYPREPWQILQRLGSIDRSEATLTVSIPAGADSDATARAKQATAAWNAGDDRQAMDALYDLGLRIDPLSIELCFSWHHSPPVRGSTMFSSNVRVGTLDSVTSVALAANLDGSRLYAMLAHAGESGSMQLYRSTDRGDTWERTVTITGSGLPPQMAISPLTPNLYVAYFPGAGSPTLRVRKFSMDTGEMATFVDGTLTDEMFTLGAGDSVHEVTAASNLAALNDRMYFAVRTHGHRVRIFWGRPSMDTLWQEIPELATTGAARGLSASYAYGALGHRIYLSYVDTLGRVTIDTAANTARAFRRVAWFANAGAQTSISAYRDTALCAFDYNGPTAQVRTLMTTNGGTTWTLDRPVDTTETNESPAVMLEKGLGMSLFYRHYTGGTREGRLIARAYRNTTRWDSSRVITDHVPHYWRSGIAALGDSSWGVLYIVSNTVPALQSVFFVRYRMPPRPDVGVAVDEDGEQPLAFSLFQNYPDPFNPATVIPYELASRAQVRLCVNDLLGRTVATLVDGIEEPGPHRVTWRPEGIATGVYLYRLEVANGSATRRMLLLR